MINKMCKYIQIPNKEEEERVGRLVELLRAAGFDHYAITERSEGYTKYVDVRVSVKVTRNQNHNS